MMKKMTSYGHDTPPVYAIPEEILVRLKKGDPSVLIPNDDNIQPTPKVLAIEPQKCNGCRLCEIACSLFHCGEVDIARSRIHIMEWNKERNFLPVLCQHCADAPCRAACPKEAISWRDDWGRVVIDYNRCVSCQMCLAACPFGAIGFDKAREVVFKCDLCDGQPQCVSFCEPGALTFTYADRIPSPRIRQAAGIMRRY
jgi:Fe-S-cluster-containing hydrogenase component 2